MIDGRNKIWDGWNTLAGGQDSGRDPSQIEKNQAAKLVNAVCRGGIGAEARPAFLDVTLDFANRNLSYDDDGVFESVEGTPNESVDNFHDSVFQEASYFAPRGTSACIMAMIGGRQYQITPKISKGVKVREVPLERRSRNNILRGYMQQADRFHVTQDGESRPIIFDGVTSRRAKTNEIPVGTFMAYGMGRLCVTVHGRQIAFGDLYGSHAGTDPGDSVLFFEESTFISEGFNAAVGFSLGSITGLHFAPQQDSAVGDGELLAFSESGVTSFFLSQPRELWKDSAFQRITLLNIGGRGHSMIVSVNGDLWFRSDDGWRSYRQARAEIQGWAHLPMSTEVRDYMDADSPTLLQFGSAILFNNRLIATCSPRYNQGRPYHNRLTSLDFDVLSSFGQATRPAWDGTWTKLKFLKLVTGKFHGKSRAFIFGIDADGKNQLYELEAEPGGKDFGTDPVSWEIQMRSFNFDAPFNEADILSADAWVHSVNDTATITATYRTDKGSDWLEWFTLPTMEATGECGAITCGGCPTKRAGIFPRQTFPTPTPVCSPDRKRKSTLCFEFQPRLQIEGYCIVNRFRVTALKTVEDERSNC
jgi:hypothetical protein